MRALTVERLKELLSYDAATGLFTWRVSRSNVKAGSIAGTRHSEGYVQIGIDGELYYAHRLAWLYVYGEWPVDEIDHLKNERSDNKIIRLREASRAQNTCNQSKQKRKATALKGVWWHKRGRKWTTQIQVNGKRRYLGLFETPELAHEFYCLAADMLHGEFANHGAQP